MNDIPYPLFEAQRQAFLNKVRLARAKRTLAAAADSLENLDRAIQAGDAECINEHMKRLCVNLINLNFELTAD